ncbi:MAG: enoyl-CoA hydratase [Proteobacteria bacterium]|jgi:enoyl-CoA hydratase|nr:enoyl-CoA hydratase [Pseudomonadota bacterium]
MTYKSIISEIENNIGLITLNRPEALNALNSELINEMDQCLKVMDNDDHVRVIVITGSDKAFAAGADITEMAKKDFSQVFSEDLFGSFHNNFMLIRKPIIAAVAGYALGGGCELAMMCDFIVAADTAKFGQPEVNLGVMPGLGGSQRLSRFVGKSKAMDMNLTGRLMDSEEALSSGLVSRVVPCANLISNTLAIAAKIAEKSLMSTRAIKESVNRSFEVPLSEGLLFERRMFHSLFATEDQSEGMTAFVEKRSPKFKDK